MGNMDDYDDYDDDFHEFSGSGGDLSALGSPGRGENQPSDRSPTSRTENNPENEAVTQADGGGEGGDADPNTYSGEYEQDDGEEGDDEGDNDQIETEVDPKSGILKLGQPIENIRDERLEMSGRRFKFPDEISRDDLGVSGDDHFREIYASPTQQQYIDGTIEAITGGGGRGNKQQQEMLAMTQGETMYSERFDDEDFSDPENQEEDLYPAYAPQHLRSKPQQQQRKQGKIPMQSNNHERISKQFPARKAKAAAAAAAGFGGGPSLQRQLDLALKRLHVAERERKILGQKLNASAAQAELVRLRSIADQQGKRIKNLEADKRALEGRMRHQAHKLQEAEAGVEKLKEFGNNSSMSSERQIEILLERVRRLTTQVKQLREHGKEKDARLKAQGQKVQKLKAYIETHIKQHLKGKQPPSIIQDSVISGAYHHEDDQSLMDGGSMFTADVHVEGMSELQALRYQLEQLDRDPFQVSEGGRQQGGDDIPASGSGKDVEAILRRSVAQLKRSLTVQKKGLTKEIRDLNQELKDSRQNEERLEQLLDERERHARAQVLAVKQLRQTCEELEEGNDRLMMASDIYSRPVQHPEKEVEEAVIHHAREPERSAIEYTIRGGPVLHPTKPSQPSGNSSRPVPPGRKLAQSSNVRDENHGASGRVFL